MTNTLYGVSGSSGLAIGTAFWWKRELHITERLIQCPQEEIKRLEESIRRTRKHLVHLHQVTLNKVGEDEAFIFDAHLSFLEDPSFIGEMKQRIEQEGKNAELICEMVIKEMYTLFQSLDDEYMRARAEDIRDVGNKLLENLIDEDDKKPNFPKDTIIIADDLTPSDTVQFSDEICGIITARGSKNSHAAIIARTLGIPAVFGLQQGIEKIHTGDTVCIDGDTGTIQVNPPPKNIKAFHKRIEQRKLHTENTLRHASEDTYTVDGKRISVFANIGHPQDIEIALCNHAEGVGLFRSEFLYLDNTKWPTELEQLKAYKRVLKAFSPKPVIIRTLDIGGDKNLSYAKLPVEENPYLGCRGIRYCLKQKDIFKTQLRALLRASTYGNLWILLPMVSSTEQISLTKQLIEESKSELHQEHIPFCESSKLGIMIEVPATALCADTFAKEVDFFSIGTNDLTQYTLAADRGNTYVSTLYDETHPSVLRMIEMVCQAAQREGIPVGICGELAGNQEMTETFIRMGVEELSVTPNQVPRIKQVIRSIELKDAYANV